MSTTIESLELEIKHKTKNASDGIDALVTSLGKLKDATKGLGLSSVSKELGNVSSSAKGAKSSFEGLGKTLKSVSDINKKSTSTFTDLYHKIKSGVSAIKSVGKVIGSAIGESNDYVENMNLFTVAMGEYADEAKGYAETVSNAMGIDTSEWVRAQGIFMTISTGFGVASDRAYTMSKNLTQLGYDLSSFYNLDIEDAMDKLKSGLAGELEPLRAIGYDLSQAKLEATALALGIDKSVSSMTQAEKAQLRYYAIMTQVTTAQGDMARTLDDPANQLRVLKAEISMAAREIGNVFIPALNAILPYVIAAVKVIRVLASNIASLFGYEMPDMSESTNKVVENTDALSENLQKGQEEAKKLKSYMLGFDELNVINPNEGSSTAGEDVSSGFDFDLPEYDFMSGLVDSKVDEIVEDMKEWLGITGDIDSWADLLDTKLGGILTTVGLIGAGLAAWKIGMGIVNTINSVAAAVKNVSAAVNLINGSQFVGWLTAFISLAKEGGFVAAFGAAFPKLSAALAAIAPVALPVLTIIGGIVGFVWGLVDAIKEGIDWLNALGVAIGATAVGAGIGFAVGGPIGAAIGALIGFVVGLVTDLVILIVQEWDAISAWFSGVGKWFNKHVIQPIVKFFEGLWTSVSGFFSDLWDDIVGIWNSVASWFDETVIQPIVNFFEPIFTETIPQIFEGCWLIIQAVWLVVSTWFNDNVIVPVVEFFKGLWTSVSGVFSSLWEDVTAVWNVVATWFNDTVIVPVVGFFEGIWTSVSSFFSSLWEDIKVVWEGVSSWFDETVIQPVKTVFETVCGAIGGFFSGLWLGIRQGAVGAMNGLIGAVESAINWVIGGINGLLSGFDGIVQWAADILGQDWGGMTLIKEVSFATIPMPTYAEGAYGIPAGQMFVAREAGAEMVGSIGRKTTVANNDQIVEGIAGGVAEANSEQNVLLREQNSLLRAILEKDSGVYLDGKTITNSVEKYQRERGRVLITGGVL